MANDPGLALRVSRLENDRDSIYELLGDLKRVQDEHSARFDGIDGRLDGIDGRLDGIDGRLNGFDGRLNGIDERLDTLVEGMTEVLRRLPG